MNSKLNQKLLVFGLIVSLCFLAACGKSSDSGGFDFKPSEGETTLTGPATCYAGAKNDHKACVSLKAISPTREGYRNPHTDSSFMPNGNKNQYRMPIKGVNLAITPVDLKLAPNFKITEFMTQAKGHFGIFSTKVVGIIQRIREQARGSLRINSAFRSPSWNEGIDGSAKWSRHQYGDAVDIASPTASLDRLVQLCKSMGATYVDKYVKHVHCDWRNTTVEPSFFGETKPQLKTLSAEEEKMNILSDLMDSSDIQIAGNLRGGNIVLLTSSVAYKEDAEELYKRWVIFKPNGDQIDLEQAEVSLPLERGTYQVVHYIGENIQLNKSFFVQ